MPYFKEYCEPDKIAQNEHVVVYQAYQDEDYDAPFYFYFIPAPPDVDPQDAEDEYASIDIHELGYEDSPYTNPTEWIANNLDKFIEAITPIDYDAPFGSRANPIL